MAITVDDVKLYRGSKRDQTPTAGGLPSGVVVVDGVVNNLFQNISRLDRVKGEISLEKVFVGVCSANTDTYKGSFMTVCDPPFDKNVNVMLLKSPSYKSTRGDVIDYIESFFNLGVEAGNAGLAYPYLPGAEQILYLLRWYEYSPHYSAEGAMIMSTKYDLKQTMNINVGDILWLGDPAKHNGEYIEVKGIETLYENMPDPDKNHYYNKVYLSVQLASPLENTHYTTDITKRTTQNTAWEVFGCMRLKSSLIPGDTFASIVDVTGRLVPVIERNQVMKNQVVYQPSVLKDNVSITAGGLTIDMAQVKKMELSEHTVINGQSVNHNFEYGPVDPATVAFRYRHQKRWVMSEADSTGLLSGEVMGAVTASGQAMSLILALAPDPGTVGIVTYMTQHQYEVCSSQNLLSAGLSNTQSEIRNIAQGIATYQVKLSSDIPCRLQKGKVKIYALLNDVYTLVSQDDMYGALGGQLSGTVDYAHKMVTITSFGSVVTRTLKYEYTVDLFRKRVFTQNDFSVSADGLLYTLSVGSEIIKPQGMTELFSKMSIVFDVWDAPSGTPTARESTRVWSGTAYNSMNGTEPDTGYMIGGNAIGIRWHNIGIGLILFQTGIGPVIDYPNGTISFPLSADRVQPLSKGSDPDAALKSISVEVLVADGGSLGTQLPLPLHFNKTGLVPGGVTGVVVNPDGVWNFYDNKQGVFKLEQKGISGTAETVATDGFGNYTPILDICDTPSGIMVMCGPYADRFISLNGGKSWVHVESCGIYKTKVAYGVMAGHGEFYINYGVYFFDYSASATGPRTQISVGAPYAITAVAFGNGACVIAVGTTLYINSDGFTSAPSTWPAHSGSAALNTITRIKFGKDGKGNGRFVCVSSAGIIIYGAGAANGSGWIEGLMPWSESTNWLEYTDGNGGVWVCVGKNKHIAWSKDGAIWVDVDSSFMDAKDTHIYGLSVSSDGLFILSATFGKYSTRDGFKWAYESSHPEITTDNQYQIIFSNNQWVELYTNPTTKLVSLIRQNQQTLPTIVDIGTIDYATGEGELTQIEHILSVSSTMYLATRTLTKFAVQTRGADPVTPGTFRLACTAVSGKSMTCVGTDATGILSGDATGVYSAEHGYAFGEWSEPYYPETLLMDAGYRSMYHPNFEGLNEKALPLDGRVPLIKKDALAMITDKGSYRLAANMDADDLTVMIADISGWPPVLPDPCLITIGSETLNVSVRNGSTLTIAPGGRGYHETVAASHAKGSVVYLTTFNMELNPVASVQHGAIQFANDVAHSYSAGAVVSAVIESGDLQAVLEEYHTQSSWDNSKWFNTTEWDAFVAEHQTAGLGPAGGVYNFTDHPIVLANIGCVTERWLIEITSTSPLYGQIRGEYLGVIASNVSLAANISPINPNVNTPYFMLYAAGFSGGWQVGNILRFNTKGALSPAWVMRVVEAKASTASDDGAEIWVGGDVPVD